MANIKFSELETSITVNGNDKFHFLQGKTNKLVTKDELFSGYVNFDSIDVVTGSNPDDYLHIIQGTTHKLIKRSDIISLNGHHGDLLGLNDDDHPQYIKRIELKTVGAQQLIGDGDITFKTINNDSIVGTGNIEIVAGGPSGVYEDVAKNMGVGTGQTFNTINGEMVDRNIAIGEEALNSVSAYAGDNVAVGVAALKSTTGAYENIAVGTSALQNNTTGDMNVAISSYGMFANTTGICNVAVGSNTLASNTGGSYNVAIGYESLMSNTLGEYNIAIGNDAMYYSDAMTCINNVAIGHNAMIDNHGNTNIAIGTDAIKYGTSANTNNIAIGEGTLGSTSVSLCTATANIAIGPYAMTRATSANDNISIGYFSQFSITDGYGNIAFGDSALHDNMSGYQNVAIGKSSLSKYTDNNAVAIGFETLKNATSATIMVPNIAIGYRAGTNITIGGGNIALGASALLSATSGNNNIAIGTDTLRDATSGYHNSAVGDFSLTNLTTGITNTAIGRLTGELVTTGSHNTFIGNEANLGSPTQRNYATAIGALAVVDSDDTVVLGRTSDTTVIGAIAKDASNNARLQVSSYANIKGTAPSDILGNFGYNTSTNRLEFRDDVGFNTVSSVEKAISLEYTPSGTTTVSISKHNTLMYATVATGSTTWAFPSSLVSGEIYSITLELTNGGSQTQTWPAAVKWEGGTAPTLTAAGLDILTFYTRDGGTTWRGFLSSKDSK